MKKKIVLIITLLFICAGCDVKYTLNIDKDLKVKETVAATEPTSFFEDYPKSSKGKVISDIIEPYLDTLNKNKYDVTNYIGSYESGVTINKEYDDLKSYSEGSIFTSQYSEDKVSIKEEGDKITLSLKGNFSYSSQNQTKLPVKTAKIQLVVPYKVIEHNANSVSGNTYTWKFNEDSLDKEIKLTFDKKVIYKPKKEFDFSFLIIIGAVVVLAFIGYLVYNLLGKRSKNVNDI
jgi:hypothetical protein